MDLPRLYSALSDEYRLRITVLLARGRLGVKHLQSILGISQVRVSKHLAYLRERGVVHAVRHRNWMIYQLPDPVPRELAAHLQCILDCVGDDPKFAADAAAGAAMQAEVNRVIAVGERPVREPKPSSVEPAPPAVTPGTGWALEGGTDYID